jgi:hypothetical protein
MIPSEFNGFSVSLVCVKNSSLKASSCSYFLRSYTSHCSNVGHSRGPRPVLDVVYGQYETETDEKAERLAVFQTTYT